MCVFSVFSFSSYSPLTLLKIRSPPSFLFKVFFKHTHHNFSDSGKVMIHSSNAARRGCWRAYGHWPPSSLYDTPLPAILRRAGDLIPARNGSVCEYKNHHVPLRSLLAAWAQRGTPSRCGTPLRVSRATTLDLSGGYSLMSRTSASP